MTTTTARIYVGTYAKYNAGSIAGQWLDLSDYADKDAFLAACAELHKDESDPEFMFQDMEGIPNGLASESSVEAELWDWLDLDESDKSILSMYREYYNEGTIEEARDAYAGTANSEADFAQEQAEETDSIPKDLPAWIVIDWEASWNCNLRHDYFTAKDEDGSLHFFRNC